MDIVEASTDTVVFRLLREPRDLLGFARALQMFNRAAGSSWINDAPESEQA